MKNENDAIVIGAGPAGMMAAITAARLGRKVLVIERNDRPGRKLRITGKGRCNVTNFSSPRDIMANTPGNGKFLFSCLNRFPPEAVMEFFEQIGVPLKVERGSRVFPVSDKAEDIVDALVREMRTLGIRTVKGRVRELIIEDGAVRGVSGDGFSYKAESVLIATGGLSYPKTGSTGDGYRLAKQAGHELTERGASLVPLECAGSDCPDMQGLSLRNISIELKNEAGKTVYKDFGEMLFTHFGVSGPVILSASAHMRGFSKAKLIIDLKPALDEKKLDQRILRDLEAGKNKNFSNILSGLMNPLMIPIAIRHTGIAADTKANSVTKEQRKSLISFLKHYELEVTGTRPVDEAVITTGGVDVKSINPSDMSSRLVSGLYFAGEVIDADAYTGGFNLQIAWSTGWAAGCNL